MKQEVKPAEGKLGIMVVGCGAVATTFMTGLFWHCFIYNFH